MQKMFFFRWKSHMYKRPKFGVSHPYAFVAIAWMILGIGTGVITLFEQARIMFIILSWLLLEAGWDYLGHYYEKNRQTETDGTWTKIRLRVISYSRPLFYIWLGTMGYQIIWWQSGLIVKEPLYSWLQSLGVTLCTIFSLFDFISKTTYRRSIFKWLLVIIAFFPPSWKTPWYDEPIIILQVRWIFMALLFILQTFESYGSSNNKKRHLIDIYLLRIAWVAIVEPWLLFFIIVLFLYYATTMIGFNVSLKIPYFEATTEIAEVVQPSMYNTYGIYTQTQEQNEGDVYLNNRTNSALEAFSNNPWDGYSYANNSTEQ